MLAALAILHFILLYDNDNHRHNIKLKFVSLIINLLMYLCDIQIQIAIP